MNLDRIHNFLFHPLNSEHSHTAKVLSVVTIVALSVFTRGIFAAAFALVNWYGYWQEFELSLVEADPKVERVSASLKKSEKPKEVVSPKAVLNKFVIDKAKVKRIKQIHSKQLQMFEKWVQSSQWLSIHRAHYDWWMFPVERPSAGYGKKYAVNKEEVEALKADPEFMNNYRKGVILVVQAWGWDLEKGKAINPPAKGQKWTGYGVRLGKMSDSLLLFGEIEMHQKLQLFFKQHCLPQQNKVSISDLPWLKKTLLEES